MQTGINYFFNLLSLDTGNFKVLYEFDNASSLVVPSVSGAQDKYSGILSSTVGFYNLPGRGRFNGTNYLRISNEEDLFSDNWTMVFSYEKITNDHGILFSSYHGEAIKSGFAIGVNNANKVYIESYSPDGPVVLEADLNLAAKNALAVTKAGDGVFFSLFDINSKTVESESFATDSQYLLNSTGWYLGDAVNPPSYFSGDGLRGYVDTFMYFNAALMPYQLERLLSGVFADSESGINHAYSNTFGMDGIAFTSPVNENDFIEVYTYPTGFDKVNTNQVAVFDRAYGDFLLLEETFQELVSPYLNGSAQIPSGYSISGDLYSKIFVLSGDFFISGQEIVSNESHTAEDFLQYDLVSGVREVKLVPQNYSGNAIEIQSLNSHIFLNGVKLRSGIDYVPSGSNYTRVTNPNLTGITGVLFSFPIDTDTYDRISGSFNSATGAKFARGTSQVWRNGLRQAQGINYVEIAKIDLLNGSGSFQSNPTIINNDELFWRAIPIPAEEFYAGSELSLAGTELILAGATL